MSSTGRLGLVVATALLLLPAASSGTTGSGLYGVVKKGPITPVCRQGVPCDAPVEVTLRMPIPLERMAHVSPAYTANRAVNAVPYVCAAAPGIRSTVDLAQIVTTLA